MFAAPGRAPEGPRYAAGAPMERLAPGARVGLPIRRINVPELPEVEVVRRGLECWVSGRIVADVQVLHPRAVRRHIAGGEDFGARLKGHRIGLPQRRGKYLWLPLADQPTAVLAHLGMSGQLLVQPESAPDEKHLRIRVRFDDTLATETADYLLRG